jgi:DNA modification methylase
MRNRSVIDNYSNKLQIEDLPIASLKPYARNPRTHSPKQIEQIGRSIREFGFTNPVLVDADGGVIAGHGRIEAAKSLGIRRVPTIRLDHMTDAQKRAYVIADNRLAETAGWDRELLAHELQYLSSLDLEFDTTLTGFDSPEIDVLIQELDLDGAGNEADEIPNIDTPAPSVSQLGDLWRLGEHRLLCADATKQDSFSRLLQDAKAQMIFTDPPYNVRIDGNVCGLGAIKHREFQMASGEMTEAEFVEFLRTTLRHMASFSVDGSMHFVCMDWRHCFELISAGRSVYSELKNLCVWNKTNGGMGSLYRSKHELVFVFKNGNGTHINNIELGSHGRYRTNVWDYPGITSMQTGRLDELAMHPTVKPTALVADAILDCSKRGGIVLDCFGGSGTTLVAAEKTGRRGYVIEIDPAYVDVSLRRFEKLTGKKARHAENGLTFQETKDRQSNETELTKKD